MCIIIKVLYSISIILYNVNFICCATFSSSSSSSPSATTRGIQINRATTPKMIHSSSTSERTLYEQGLEDYDEAKESMRKSRGMMMMMNDDDDIAYHHDDHDEHIIKEQPKAAIEDPWEGYYDFIINEGSFKFWAAFQLVTAALLIYSAFAAVYYAKFQVITTDYDYYDDFGGRSNSQSSSYSSLSSSLWSGLSSQTFQRIMDAISSKKYT